MAPALQFLVQITQKDVGKQGRQRTALGNPLGFSGASELAGPSLSLRSVLRYAWGNYYDLS
jgi:hypothetical protein